MKFKWFKKMKKLTTSTEYDTRYLLDVLNYEPRLNGFSSKFLEDGTDCENKEYKVLKDLTLDDKNTDVRTATHKADTAREIAYLNSCFIDSLLCTKNLLSKAVGDIVCLNDKLALYERDARILEEKLEEEELELSLWEEC